MSLQVIEIHSFVDDTQTSFTSFNCGGVWGHGLVVVKDVSRYGDRWSGQDGDWHWCWDSRTDGFGSQQQVGGLRVGAETPNQHQHVSNILSVVDEQTLFTRKRLHIVTRYISLTLPCDFACVCVYLSVVVWAVVRTMRPKNLHAWSRSICMSDPHSTGLRSELEAGDVSSSLHTCRYLWPLLQYHLMDWTSVSLPDSPQGGFIWDLVFQLLGCLNCLHRGKCTCFIICGLYQDRFIISVRLYSCENSSQ